MSFLAIFDVDGTLVDSQHHIVASMEFAHARVGMACPERPRILEIVGLSLPEAMRQLHPDVSEAGCGALVAAYKEAFHALRTQSDPANAAPLYPGVTEGLDRLGAAGLLMATATGKSRRGLDATLDTHGLARHFTSLQCADGHPSKPHPSMVLAALAEVGSDPARAAMIGDTEYDVAMGRAAGIAAIGVAWGYHPPARLTAAGANRIAADFPALVALLLELAE
jgi:phosphoglycolate phosphatase